MDAITVLSLIESSAIKWECKYSIALLNGEWSGIVVYCHNRV